MVSTILWFQLFSGFIKIVQLIYKISSRRSISSSTNSICGYASSLMPMHVEYLQN